MREHYKKLSPGMRIGLCLILIFILLTSCSGSNHISASEATPPDTPSDGENSGDIIGTNHLNERAKTAENDNEESYYYTKEDDKIGFWDFNMAYDLCQSALTDYYYAARNNSDINLDLYISNENLKAYTERKIKVEQSIRKKANVTSLIDDVSCGVYEVNYIDNAVIYFKIGARIDSGVGYSAEPTEFLVGNQDGRLVILDWYTKGLDSIDVVVRGEAQVIDNPDIWNDNDWVQGIFDKLEKLEDKYGA